jgi:hypothetical protein
LLSFVLVTSVHKPAAAAEAPSPSQTRERAGEPFTSE